MNYTEEIIHNNKVIALIIYKGYKQDGVKFFSPKEYLLQLGYMKHPEGYRVAPHTHNAIQRNTTGTQELFFIQSGEIRIDFYSQEHLFLESRKLSAGDIVLLVSGGHGLQVIKEAVIFEVKNGPYVDGADKGRFEASEGKHDTC